MGPGDKLVRPVNAPGPTALTPGIQPGSPGVVVAGQVIIVGGQLLVYFPTAGPGNLVGSVSGQAGTDRFGNAYVPELAAYGTSTIAKLFTSAGVAALGVQVTGLSDATQIPAVFASAANIGAANELQILVVSSGKESSHDDAALQLFSETADTTGAAVAIFEFGGQVETYTSKFNGVSANQPGTISTPETWHAVSLPAGMTGTVQVKILALSQLAILDINASVTSTSTSPSNLTGGNLPAAAYYPGASRQYDVSTNQHWSTVANASPRITIPTSGGIVFNLPGYVTGGQTALWEATIIYPLDGAASNPFWSSYDPGGAVTLTNGIIVSADGFNPGGITSQYTYVEADEPSGNAIGQWGFTINIPSAANGVVAYPDAQWDQSATPISSTTRIDASWVTSLMAAAFEGDTIVDWWLNGAGPGLGIELTIFLYNYGVTFGGDTLKASGVSINGFSWNLYLRPGSSPAQYIWVSSGFNSNSQTNFDIRPFVAYMIAHNVDGNWPGSTYTRAIELGTECINTGGNALSQTWTSASIVIS